MGVAHFAVEFGLGDESCDGVDNQHVDSAGSDQSFSDFERLLAAVGLGDEKVVDIDAQLLGVPRVKSVFRVDEGGQTAQALGFGNDLQRDRRLAGGFRSEDLSNPAARHAAHAERSVEADGSSGDNGDRQQGFFGAETDDGALAKLLFDLGKGEFYGFGAVIDDGHFGRAP